MKREVDLAIVGSGFAGSLLALIARRLGRSVVLLEKGRHPRFVIGESSTPLANLLLEELARRYDLPELLPFTKYGAWRRERPDVRCGLKRGFTFYHHRAGERWRPDPARANELLVAASPRDAIADTHWYRPDFDEAFVRLATARGAELVDEVTLDRLEVIPNGAVLHGRNAAEPVSVSARFVIDASGRQGFVSRALGLAEDPVPFMPATKALYSHFTGVHRWDGLHPSAEAPPYPVDDAAMHHVFDGGWIWVLRFGHGVVSAGVAATDALAKELRLAEGAPGWARLMARFPSIAEQFAEARPVREFDHLPRMGFRVGTAAGPGWALLPSAAGFVDPLLSTGFPLTLLGVERLARCLEEDWGTARWEPGVGRHGRVTLEELDRAAGLIGALYGQLDHFARFVPLALLYFGAASYSETARRLGRPELAEGFLLRGHARFSRSFDRCLELARRDPSADDALTAAVREALQPINVAGLGEVTRRQWYPAQAEDLFAAADKFGPGIGVTEIQAMLRRVGF